MKRRTRSPGRVEALLAVGGHNARKPTATVAPAAVRLRKPDGFTLRQVAWRSLAGDLLSRGGHTHRGSVDRADQYGRTKREVYEATLSGDLSWFDRVAKEGWSRETRRGLFLSTRAYVPKDSQEGQPTKFRAIDAPSEAARLLSQYILDQIRPEAEKHLADNLFAYREMGDVAGGLQLPEGVTIQDVFALRVQRALRTHPFALLVDLEDAFGNLPHGAIHEALREVGLNRRDRQQVLDLVSIHAREPNGAITRSPGKGISQGSPLSPLVFNLTFGYLLRRVTAGSPWCSFSYGDDLVMLAKDHEGAVAAFAIFKDEATKLGFRVRGFVTTGPVGDIPADKGTRIYDTRAEAVPLIKTFLVSTTRIALTRKHTGALVERLKARGIQSITGARRASTYKSASKSFLRACLGGDDEDLNSNHGPLRSMGGGETPSSSLTAFGPGQSTPQGGGDLVSIPVVRNASFPPCGEDDTGTRSPLSPVGHVPERSPVVAVSPLVAHPAEVGTTADVGLTATAPGDRPGFHATGKVRDGGVSNATVVGAENPVTGEEGTGASHRPTTGDAPVPRSVRQLASEDIDALRAGRCLKVGDRYRGEVLDLTFLRELDGPLRGEAFRQCLRVGSFRGVTRLMVPPGASWIAEYELAGRPHVEGWRLCRREYDQGALRLTLRRVAPKVGTTRRRRRPPAADLVIEHVRPDRDARDTYRIGYLRDGVRGVACATVRGVLLTATTLLAAARVLATTAPTTVALPAIRGWPGLLLDGPNGARRATHPALHDAMKVLRRWRWEAVDGWLVGTRAGTPN